MIPLSRKRVPQHTAFVNYSLERKNHLTKPPSLIVRPNEPPGYNRLTCIRYIYIIHDHVIGYPIGNV